MAYKTIYTEVEVDVDMSDFDTDDLIEELESRGTDLSDFRDVKELLESIWLKRREKRDFSKELDDLIYYGIGKVI